MTFDLTFRELRPDPGAGSIPSLLMGGWALGYFACRIKGTGS